MAIVVGKTNFDTFSFVAGDRVVLSVDIKGDSAYPNPAGSPVTPQMFGLDEVHHIDPTMEAGGSTLMAFDTVNKTLKCYTAFGTQVTNGTDLSSKVWRALVIGKGRPRQIN
jgi:hypothetical protein